MDLQTVHSNLMSVSWDIRQYKNPEKLRIEWGFCQTLAVHGGVLALFTKLRQNTSVPNVGRYRSGQTGQTVNLLAQAYEGSNPSRPTTPQ